MVFEVARVHCVYVSTESFCFGSVGLDDFVRFVVREDVDWRLEDWPMTTRLSGDVYDDIQLDLEEDVKETSCKIEHIKTIYETYQPMTMTENTLSYGIRQRRSQDQEPSMDAWNSS